MSGFELPTPILGIGHQSEQPNQQVCLRSVTSSRPDQDSILIWENPEMESRVKTLRAENAKEEGPDFGDQETSWLRKDTIGKGFLRSFIKHLRIGFLSGADPTNAPRTVEGLTVLQDQLLAFAKSEVNDAKTFLDKQYPGLFKFLSEPQAVDQL